MKDRDNLRRLFSKTAGPSESQPDLGGGEAECGASDGPQTHLEFILLDAKKRYEQGEYTLGLMSMGHAVLVAAEHGRQGLSEHELLTLVRSIIGFDWHPDEAA